MSTEQERRLRGGASRGALYEVLGSIYGTPFRDVARRFGVSYYRFQRILEEGEAAYELSRIISEVSGLSLYDAILLTYEDGALSVVGFGREFYERNKVEVKPPLDIVDEYPPVVVFRDAAGETVYYKSAMSGRNTNVSKKPLLPELRTRYIDTLTALLGAVVGERVEVPAVLVWYMEGYEVYRAKVKGDGFGYMRKEPPARKIEVGAREIPEIATHLVLLEDGVRPIYRIQAKHRAVWFWHFLDAPLVLREAWERVEKK